MFKVTCNVRVIGGRGGAYRGGGGGGKRKMQMKRRKGLGFMPVMHIRYCPGKKERGQEVYQSLASTSYTIALFFNTSKGLPSCFKFKNPVTVFRA